jgi:hypothetical protein
MESQKVVESKCTREDTPLRKYLLQERVPSFEIDKNTSEALEIIDKFRVF